jgi:hypothetical protein
MQASKLQQYTMRKQFIWNYLVLAAPMGDSELLGAIAVLKGS